MTNAEAQFNKSHIRKVYACLAVACHLHFWQNDQDLLRVWYRCYTCALIAIVCQCKQVVQTRFAHHFDSEVNSLHRNYCGNTGVEWIPK